MPGDHDPKRVDVVTTAIAIAGVLATVVSFFHLPGLEKLIIVVVGAVAGVAVTFWWAGPTPSGMLVVVVALLLAGDAPSPPVSFPVIGAPALLANLNNASNGLELLTPIQSAGLINCWSGAKIDHRHWTTPYLFGRDLGTVEAVALTQSDFAAPGNLEVIARHEDRLVLYWREFWQQPPTQRWRGPLPMEVNSALLTGASGAPALVQIKSGPKGDFLLVSPREAGGLGVYRRDNRGRPPFPWSELKPLGGREPFTAVAMTRTASDVIDLVAQGGHRLLAARYDHGRWTPLVQVATSAGPVGTGRGNLALTRSARGLELVVPDPRGGLALYWRSDQAPGWFWQGPVRIGQAAGLFDGVAVATAGTSKRIDIVARQQQSLQHFFDLAGGGAWHGPFPLSCDDSGQIYLASEAP